MTTPSRLGVVAPLLMATISQLLMGCRSAPPNLAQGIIVPGTPQRAFVDAWGLPDRQQMRSGEEFTSANWNGFGGGQFKGKTDYCVWIYESRKTELAFDRKRNLVGFTTDLSRQELEATYQLKK